MSNPIDMEIISCVSLHFIISTTNVYNTFLNIICFYSEFTCPWFLFVVSINLCIWHVSCLSQTQTPSSLLYAANNANVSKSTHCWCIAVTAFQFAPRRWTERMCAPDELPICGAVHAYLFIYINKHHSLIKKIISSAVVIWSKVTLAFFLS